jgi:hypothetical protein
MYSSYSLEFANWPRRDKLWKKQCHLRLSTLNFFFVSNLCTWKISRSFHQTWQEQNFIVSTHPLILLRTAIQRQYSDSPRTGRQRKDFNKIASLYLFNNQPDALIIHIYSVIKLHRLCPSSGVFYCSFSTGKFHAGVWCRCQDGTAVPSWLSLEAVIRNLHETYQCRMYSRKLLMMGREDTLNM